VAEQMPGSLSPGQAEKLKHDWEFFGASISEAMCSPICPGGFRRTVGTRLVGKKYNADGKLVDNPNAKWAISDTTRDVTRETIAKVPR
jgi:hypothetical protein